MGNSDNSWGIMRAARLTRVKEIERSKNALISRYTSLVPQKLTELCA
jgi:hypothetical protein